MYNKLPTMFVVFHTFLMFSLLIFVLFLFSKLAVFDGQKSIRGGIPIVFRKYHKMK